MKKTLLNGYFEPKKLNLRFLVSFLLTAFLFSVNLNAQTRNRVPVAIAGADQTFDCVPTVGQAIIQLDGSGSTDADGNPLTYQWIETRATIANGINPTIALPPGIHTIELIVNDGRGGISSAFVTITVNTDTTAPSVVTKPATVTLDAFGNANITTFDIDGGSTDNCSVVTLQLGVGQGNFTCANLGNNNVTLVGTDASGNASSATATVTVVDNTAPIIIAQNFTADLDETGLATIVPSNIDNGSRDNCNLILSIDKTDFTCANIGVNTVTLTGTDSSGNTATAQATVTITNNVLPMVMAKYLTVFLDESGMASIVPSEIDNGSFYNCGLVLSLDKTDFTCADLGQNLITLIGTDPSGNRTIAETIVTVVDNIAPIITCPADITISTTNIAGVSVNYTAPVGTDNCSVGLPVLTAGLPSGSVFPVGTTVVTHSVTDAFGNTSTCSFNVTVVNIGVAPVITCPANITVNNDLGSCGANVPFVATETVGIPASVITYSIAPGSYFIAGTTLVTATATNASGSSSCTFNITVIDNTTPIITCPADITISTTNIAGVSVNYTAPVGTDNCSVGLPVLTAGLPSGSVFPVGTTVVTHSVTDAFGNTSTCSFNVTVTKQAVNCDDDDDEDDEEDDDDDDDDHNGHADNHHGDNDDDHNGKCDDDDEDDDEDHNGHTDNHHGDDDDDHNGHADNHHGDDDDDHNGHADNHHGDDSKSKKSETKVMVYPNPVGDDFVIGLNQKGEGSVEIYDNKGNRIFKKDIKDLKEGISINMRGKKAGTYFAKIKCKGKVYTANIFKDK